MERKFNVCYGRSGIVSYDAESNDSMTSVITSLNKSEWEKYDWDDGEIIRKALGWKLKEILPEEDY